MYDLAKLKDFANGERIAEDGIVIPKHMLSELTDWIEKQNNKIIDIKQMVKGFNNKNLPIYKCEKLAQAFKIDAIFGYGKVANVPPLHSLLISEDGVYEVIVSNKYIVDNGPDIGGYYVKYINGDEDYISAREFEKDYKLA